MSVVAPPSDHSSSEAGGGGGAESTDRGRSEAPFRDDWQQSSTMLSKMRRLVCVCACVRMYV